MAHAPLHHPHVPGDDWHVPIAGLWFALFAILVIAGVYLFALVGQ
jgi:hypothetical protein